MEERFETTRGGPMNAQNLPESLVEHVREPDVAKHLLEGYDTFPNNEACPLLTYEGVVKLPSDDPARIFEELFSANGWRGSWRNGIYGYHHYHSTAHEVLGIYSGEAQVQLGGPNGITVTLHPGDVVVIPAGVAHKNLGSSGDFGVVGAYPAGQNWDMNYGKEGERPQVDENIAQVPMPETDPVYGAGGPLIDAWS
jgi:uncharacterized protein YjlB